MLQLPLPGVLLFAVFPTALAYTCCPGFDRLRAPSLPFVEMNMFVFSLVGLIGFPWAKNQHMSSSV